MARTFFNGLLASAFDPMNEAERVALLEKTRQAAESGRFEPFKTAPNYDGPFSRRMHGIR
ncbi:MAG TPA: hypothetical protein ENN87_00910 [Phycisphaerales bacterium]|nr:hypothetical protein [Phycisphaerales bacterium]